MGAGFDNWLMGVELSTRTRPTNNPLSTTVTQQPPAELAELHRESIRDR